MRHWARDDMAGESGGGAKKTVEEREGLFRGNPFGAYLAFLALYIRIPAHENPPFISHAKALAAVHVIAIFYPIGFS